MNHTVHDSKELERRIALVDLRPIKVKLMDTEEGKGWSRAKVDKVELLYRRFLLLTVAHDESIVPTEEVDEFWHAHILDTRKYAEDCEKTFGYFVHHFPYFGMRGPEDAKALQVAFERTKEIFLEEFGVPYVASGQTGDTCLQCNSGKCRSAVSFEVRPTLN